MGKTRILLQAGHIAPREPGFESGTGAAHEQEFALKIRTAQAKLFNADGRFDVTEAPGDLPDGWTGQVAIFNHLDGSSSPSSRGISFGYQTPQGHNLADRIRANFAKIGHPGAAGRQDNYTRDLAGYYGFRHTNAVSEVVIEHGFSSNPGELAFMFGHIDLLARATYDAVLAHLGMSPGFLAKRRVNHLTGAALTKYRNNLTVVRTTPTGQVTTWQGWSNLDTSASNPLRVIAVASDTMDFKSTFDIRWQDHWFRQKDLGVAGIVNVAKSIYSRFSS